MANYRVTEQELLARGFSPPAARALANAGNMSNILVLTADDLANLLADIAIQDSARINESRIDNEVLDPLPPVQRQEEVEDQVAGLRGQIRALQERIETLEAQVL